MKIYLTLLTRMPDGQWVRLELPMHFMNVPVWQIQPQWSKNQGV